MSTFKMTNMKNHLGMKRETFISNDVTVTAHILPWMIYVERIFKQYIHEWVEQSQKLKSIKWRQWRRCVRQICVRWILWTLYFLLLVPTIKTSISLFISSVKWVFGAFSSSPLKQENESINLRAGNQKPKDAKMLSGTKETLQNSDSPWSIHITVFSTDHKRWASCRSAVAAQHLQPPPPPLSCTKVRQPFNAALSFDAQVVSSFFSENVWSVPFVLASKSKLENFVIFSGFGFVTVAVVHVCVEAAGGFFCVVGV